MKSAPVQRLANRSSRHHRSCRLEADNALPPSRTLPALTPELLWRQPRETLALGRGEIHVWSAHLEQQAGHLRHFLAILSPDERARADRFHFDKDRRQFLIRRGLLRMMLARYLRIEPARLRFAYGPQGKPALCFPAVPELHFNLSHSAGIALYALAWDCDLGIDIEHIRDIPEAEQIADYYFTPRENAEWRALPRSQQAQAFLQCWTRKEACLKSSGVGLTRLGSPPAPPRADRANPTSADHWLLCELTPAPGYVATLAASRF